MATMNDCKTVQPLLAEYVDGELAEKAAWQVKLHLSSCAVCSRIADDFSATARLVSSLPEPVGPSANFEAMLARRIADQCLQPKPLTTWDRVRLWWDEQTAPGVKRPLAPALAAVAALVAMFPTAYLLTHQPGPAIKPVVIASASPEAAAHLVEGDPALRELWDEHATFSSAQALGDPAGGL